MERIAIQVYPSSCYRSHRPGPCSIFCLGAETIELPMSLRIDEVIQCQSTTDLALEEIWPFDLYAKYCPTRS